MTHVGNRSGAGKVKEEGGGAGNGGVMVRKRMKDTSHNLFNLHVRLQWARSQI